MYEAWVNDNWEVVSRSGNEWACRCPFHHDTRPSFYVNVVSGAYICFACNARGFIGQTQVADDDALRGLVRTLESLEDPPRKAALAPLRPWGRLPDAEPLDCTFSLPDGPLKRLRQWLRGRNVDEMTAAQWSIGLDLVDNRVVFPVTTAQVVTDLVTRAITAEDYPRWRYPRGFPRSRRLFGDWKALQDERRTAVIVEGQVDVIRIHQAGLLGLGLYGCLLTPYQTRLLHRLGIERVALLLDNDDEGRRGTERAWHMLRDDFDVVTLAYRGKAKDPGAMTEEELIETVWAAL